ncbi:PREDICTED: coiled-coil domain-containing protein 90B, mitochondrial-like isoform 1 [Fragaria vesca subsp. vesca]
MALSKRALKSAADSAFLLRRGLYSSSSVSTNGVVARASELVKSGGKRAFPVDTLALVRGLEAKGVPTAHAEAITSAVTGIYTDSLENVHQLQKVMPRPPPVRRFASLKIFDCEIAICDEFFFFELQTVILQEAKLSKFEVEIKSLQEHHFSMLTRETEKLQSVIDKLRSELRYELDKVAAGSRLDLNLEKGRMRDEFNNQNAETANLTNKLDREIQAVKALVETGKYEVIKYCIGTLVSMTAVGIAVLRIMMN